MKRFLVSEQERCRWFEVAKVPEKWHGISDTIRVQSSGGVRRLLRERLNALKRSALLRRLPQDRYRGKLLVESFMLESKANDVLRWCMKCLKQKGFRFRCLRLN